MNKPARPHLRRTTGRLREIANLALFLMAVYALLEMAVPRSVVLQTSMNPTLSEGQRLLVSRISYLVSEPQRGNIVVFEAPNQQGTASPLIKRLIGLPGETVEFRNQQVYINGIRLDEPYLNEPCVPANCEDGIWQLGAGEYFMMGDNRNHSRDSRAFGPIQRNQLVGRAIIRWWPPAAIDFLTYNYDEVN